MADYSVALGIQPPQSFDASRAFALAAQLKGQQFEQEQELRRQSFNEQTSLHSQHLADQQLAMQQREAAQRNSLMQMQLDQQRGGQNALADYSKDPSAPGAVDKLSRYPDIQSQVLQVRGQLAGAEQQQFDQKLLRNGRRAQYVSGFEGDAKKQAWQDSIKDALAHGDINEQQAQQYAASEPNDLLLHNVMAQAVPIQELYRAQEPTAEMRNLKAAGVQPGTDLYKAAVTGGKLLPKFVKTSDGRVLRVDPTSNEALDVTPPRPDGSTGPVGAISDDTAANLAKRYNMGETDVLTGLGSRDVGNVNRAKVLQMAQQLQDEAGLSPEEIYNRRIQFGGQKAAERTGAVQERKMEIASAELQQFIPAARGVIERLPRTSFLPFNKLIEGFQHNTLNPDQAELAARTQAIVNAYAAIIGRGNNVVTESSRHHAEALLNTAGNKETYNRVLDTLDQEASLATKAPEAVREAHRQRAGGAAPAAAPRTGPKVGDIEDGHRFKGGNPADPNSWEKVE